MGREKRKGRLNKTGESASSNGAFIGFGAFANAGGVSGSSSNLPSQESETKASNSNYSSKVRLSPIYTGSDQKLLLLFPKIGQKRDATTKSKALLDLLEFFQTEEGITKKTKAEALSHFLYLFQTKLFYDNSPRVRAHAVKVCSYASSSLPKAWKNLTAEGDAVEIHGMLLCAKADLAAEVRMAAGAYPGKDDECDGHMLDPGVWGHVKKILSYNKPIEMHMDLFQKKGGDGASTKAKAASVKLSEAQQEELEERYERIVGTAIEGMRLHLLCRSKEEQDNVIDSTNSDPSTVKYLWKGISSLKASLRRQTYALLSTVCQLPATDTTQSHTTKEGLIDPSKMCKLLSQSLASEKESANIGMLLETLLAFVVSFYASKEERATVMSKHFGKPLTKLFKKGCHGASPATSWTPTLLPLVALLPSRTSDPVAIPPKIDLLTNAWEGQNHVVSNTDRWEVISAVAETAAFLLAKEESEDSDTDSVDEDTEEAFHKILAQCWSRSLQSYLAGSASGAALRSHRKLGITLTKGWIQLDKASSGYSNDKMPSIIYNRRDWFWTAPLRDAILNKSTQTSNLTSILVALRTEQTNNNACSQTEKFWAAAVLSQKFRSLFSTKSPSWVPSRDTYGLWIAILQMVRVSTDDLFVVTKGGKDPFEDFVMNQLLPWLVLHTSSRSDQVDKDLAMLDISLFHYLTFSNHDLFTKWWDPLLREILAAEPDLEALIACLGWLLSKERGYSIADVVEGPTSGFSTFCTKVAKNAIGEINMVDDNEDDFDENDSQSEGSHDVEYYKKAQFLRGCVGLETIPEAILGDEIVGDWLECACPKEQEYLTNTKSNPVLDTLVAMIRAGKLLDDSRIERVMLQAWRQGGQLWEDKCLPWLCETSHSKLRMSMIELAGKESRSCIQSRSSSSNAALDDDMIWSWTERAYRLLWLCCVDEEDEYNPSLTIVGLGDISTWEGAYGDDLRDCLMRLLRRVNISSSRWQLFVNSETDTIDLLVTILISLSAGAKHPLEADLARRRKDSCATLLSELEFGKFNSDVVQESIHCCVSKISASLADGMDFTERTCQGIAVLSQLIESHFLSLRPRIKTNSSKEKLDPDDVRVGDQIWYITKADDPFSQEPCILVKIHRDLPEEVYFTIKLDRDGVKQERQTIGERLRKYKSSSPENAIARKPKTFIWADEVDDEEKRSREKIAGAIVDQLISLIDDKKVTSSYEVYSIAIAQCGLISGRGIGSLHYSVVQKLIALQKDLSECLSSSDAGDILTPTLWRLSLALGFGMNVPASKWTVPLIGLNATDTLPSLLDYDGDEEKEPSKEIDCAMAAWLSVCSPACEDTVLRAQSYSLLFGVASRLLRDDDHLNKDHYIALRAIEVGQSESHKTKEGESIIQDSEAEALVELTKAFATYWSSDGDNEASSNLESHPLFDSIMRASLNKRPSLMAIASRRCINALAEALYEPSKQYFATRLLKSYATAGRPLFEDADDDDLINQTTLDRLDEWAKDMLENEAEELEDDVASVAQWVCTEQMNDVESWHDDDDIDDEIACGRMLSWLSLLDIADTATGKDPANRISFTSYVSICKAVDAMLDLALIYANVGEERKVELDTVIPMEDIIESSIPLSKLAARVIFRSVEVFPTLSKHWWDSTCPKYLTTTVREFVEKEVSPDILKHAIKSIQNASAFGDMNVQGGAITREVSATYVQDDFTLSVLVKLPLSFPFRRAEVDCSKTLGVPAHRWKRWALQITQMLNNQGGTLKDALLLWKENVDKEFEGVEPCPICYSVLHVKSHKLPNLECNTCHNQFHTDCLYEWFKSSGKSACPICQQPWSGSRI